MIAIQEHGFPPNIAMTAPALGAGEEAEGRAGWGFQILLHKVETGEGARPLPASRHPQWG